jgi:hypothetical protein
MPATALHRQRTPFDDISPEALGDFAAFVRKHAPRWLSGSRSFGRLTVRRAREKAVACDRRRGIRHVDTAMPPSRMGSPRRR